MACEGKSDDPQLGDYGIMNPQDGVIAEAAARIKTQKGLSQQQRCPQPLVVVVTKYDAWSALTNHAALDPSWLIKPRTDGRNGLDLIKLRSLSDQVRSILHKYSPELVSAAEGNFQDVTYVPVSALGTTPEVDPSNGKLVVRPRNVNPQFAEVPLLYALHRSVEGLVPSVSPRTRDRSVKSGSSDRKHQKSPSGSGNHRPVSKPKTNKTQPAASGSGNHGPTPKPKTRPAATESEIPLQEENTVSLQDAKTQEDQKKPRKDQPAPNETYLKETGS